MGNFVNTVLLSDGTEGLCKYHLEMVGLEWETPSSCQKWLVAERWKRAEE